MEIAERDILAGSSDAVRIAPIALAEDAKAPVAARPHLTYRGGPLLTNVEVFPSFWGDWSRAEQQAGMTRILDFFDFVLTSVLLDQLSEYSTEGMKIGHGRRLQAPDDTPTTVDMKLPPVTTDGAVRHRLKHLITTDARFPKPGANVLYFVYLPPGVAIEQGGNRSCQAFCGYHDAINSQIFYAVMPWPGCGGCTGELEPIDALTSTSSHELCEAITDPVPPQGWYDDTNGEIGDICAWKTKKVGDFIVQREWSNEKIRVRRHRAAPSAPS